MALVIGDRVLETTISTGVGSPYTLAGAVSGYRAFSSVATVNGDTFYYQISAGTQWEVGLGTRVSATTFNRTTIFASSNAGAAENFAAGVKEVWMDASAEQLRWTINKSAHPAAHNISLLATVAANAVTFHVRTAAGNVPSSTDPVFLIFQGVTGTPTIVRVAAALTITVAAGATLGGANNTPMRIWLAVLLNAGVAELVVRNCVVSGGIGSIVAIEGFGTGVITTTAQAGAADDSPIVSYSVTARSNVPFFVLGCFDWDVTPLATAGTYDHVPDKILTGLALPGSTLQHIAISTTTAASATTSTFVDVISQVITPSSRCNAIEVSVPSASILTNTSGGTAAARLQNSTLGYANWGIIFLQQNTGVNANLLVPFSMYGLDYPGSVAALTYKAQISLSAGGGTAQLPSGGSTLTFMLREIMG